jgi:TonB-dependent siderophore receptor
MNNVPFSSVLARNTLRMALLATISGLPLMPAPAFAQSAQTASRQFDIPAQPLAAALQRFMQQSGVQLSYPSDLAEGRTSGAVNGTLSPAEALGRLLTGTGLTYRFVSATAVTLELAPQSTRGAITLGPVRVTGDGEGAGIASSITNDPYATEGTGSYTVRQTSGATRLGLSPRETPQSMTVITRQQLDDQQLLSVTDALKAVPGIVLSHDDSDRHFLYSRGFSTTIVQVDGLRSYDQDTSASFLTQVDTVTLDRVEVVRGANGLLKGVGNPSATINLVLKRPTNEFKGYASASAGSWNRYRGEADVSGPLNAEGSLRARAVAAFESRDDFSDYYHKEAQTFYGIVEYDLTPQTLIDAGLEYQYAHTDGSTYGGIPLFWSDGTRFIADRSFSPSSKDAYLESKSRKLFADVKQQISDDWQAHVRLTSSRLIRDMLVRQIYAATGPDKATGDAVLANQKFDPDRKAVGIDAQVTGRVDFGGWDADLIGGYSWTRGVLNRTDTIKNGTTNLYSWDGDIAPLDDWSGASVTRRRTVERETSLYGTARLRPVDGLSLILGANLATYKLRDVANGVLSRRMDENGRFVPYAGLVYDFTPNLSIYASYTDIFSPATVYDANDNLLDPVTGSNYEAGIKGAFLDGRLNASVAGFYIKQDNVAVAIPGVRTPSGAQAYEGTDGITSKGVEFEVSGEILPGWQVQGGYARVSTPEQQREGYSIPAQVKLLEDYAAINGIDIARSYVDVETAKMSGRTAFGEMLRYLRKHPRTRILLVEKTDRLYRNIKDWAIIDELGLEIHFVKENAVMSQDCRSSEKFVHGIKVLMAKAYIDNLSEETRKGMLEKAGQGMWPTCAPIGYRNIVDAAGRKVIAIDPELGPLVSRLFDWFSTGRYSIKAVTEKARAAGLRYRKSGKLISSTTVHNMLRHRIYTGAFDWLGKTYDGIHEPLTSPALWVVVQDVLNERSNAPLQSHIVGFPFHGLVQCGHCGCSLVAEIKKGRYIYYHCSGSRGKCPERFLRQEKLEEHFVSALQRLACKTSDFARLRRTIIGHAGEGSTSARKDSMAEGSKVRSFRDGMFAEDGVALLDMARTAHLALPGLSIELKHQLLELLCLECFWANGELKVTFNRPFDQFRDYADHCGYETREGAEASALVTGLVTALVQPDVETRQLIARYNAMIRLQSDKKTDGAHWHELHIVAA